MEQIVAESGIKCDVPKAGKIPSLQAFASIAPGHEDFSNAAQCNICLSHFELVNVGAIGCGHTFCHRCLLKLIQQDEKKCPTCRQKITGIENINLGLTVENLKQFLECYDCKSLEVPKCAACWCSDCLVVLCGDCSLKNCHKDHKISDFVYKEAVTVAVRQLMNEEMEMKKWLCEQEGNLDELVKFLVDDLSWHIICEFSKRIRFCFEKLDVPKIRQSISKRATRRSKQKYDQKITKMSRLLGSQFAIIKASLELDQDDRSKSDAGEVTQENDETVSEDDKRGKLDGSEDAWTESHADAHNCGDGSGDSTLKIVDTGTVMLDSAGTIDPHLADARNEESTSLPSAANGDSNGILDGAIGETVKENQAVELNSSNNNDEKDSKNSDTHDVFFTPPSSNLCSAEPDRPSSFEEISSNKELEPCKEEPEVATSSASGFDEQKFSALLKNILPTKEIDESSSFISELASSYQEIKESYGFLSPDAAMEKRNEIAKNAACAFIGSRWSRPDTRMMLRERGNQSNPEVFDQPYEESYNSESDSCATSDSHEQESDAIPEEEEEPAEQSGSSESRVIDVFAGHASSDQGGRMQLFEPCDICVLPTTPDPTLVIACKNRCLLLFSAELLFLNILQVPPLPTSLEPGSSSDLTAGEVASLREHHNRFIRVAANDKWLFAMTSNHWIHRFNAASLAYEGLPVRLPFVQPDISLMRVDSNYIYFLNDVTALYKCKLSDFCQSNVEDTLKKNTVFGGRCIQLKETEISIVMQSSFQSFIKCFVPIGEYLFVTLSPYRISDEDLEEENSLRNYLAKVSVESGVISEKMVVESEPDSGVIAQARDSLQMTLDSVNDILFVVVEDSIYAFDCRPDGDGLITGKKDADDSNSNSEMRLKQTLVSNTSDVDSEPVVKVGNEQVSTAPEVVNDVAGHCGSDAGDQLPQKGHLSDGARTPPAVTIAAPLSESGAMLNSDSGFVSDVSPRPMLKSLGRTFDCHPDFETARIAVVNGKLLGCVYGSDTYDREENMLIQHTYFRFRESAASLRLAAGNGDSEMLQYEPDTKPETNSNSGLV